MQCLNMCCGDAVLFKGLIDSFLAGEFGGRVAGCESSVLGCDESRGGCSAESPATSGREVRNENTIQTTNIRNSLRPVLTKRLYCVVLEKTH